MSSVALSLYDLEKRAQRFFEPTTTRSRELHLLFTRLESIGDVYVIGGFLRDLAYFGAEFRPISDIDLVVDGDARALDHLAEELSCSANRFGGYGLKKDGLKVDFWSLYKTWAKVNNKREVVEPSDLLDCTFFNWDAVLYNVRTGKITARGDYLDYLRQGVMEINLFDNPSVHGSLVRSLRRLVMYDAHPGNRLRWFIFDQLRSVTWDHIIESEKNAFNVTYLDQFRDSDDFHTRFFLNRTFKIRRSDLRRQMEFSFMSSTTASNTAP